MNTIQMSDKLYFAFYSEKARINISAKNDCKRTGVCKYRLADDGGDVKTTAVYKCSEYSSPEEVLEKYYLFDDAKFVGIVDEWIKTYMK